MNKEFKKMQKIAGLITESEYKENVNENMASLDQEVYMDFLNELFDALGNGANAYSESTWTNQEEELVGAISRAISAANIDIA
jgi:hypothetical protein